MSPLDTLHACTCKVPLDVNDNATLPVNLPHIKFGMIYLLDCYLSFVSLETPGLFDNNDQNVH